MTENNNSIIDKNPKPAGLLPKNIQSWILVGLALVMILIMWLTGGKKEVPSAKGSVLPVRNLAPLEVNEGKIAEMQNRIAELQREQRLAEAALAGDSHTTLPAGETNASAGGVSASDRPEDPLEIERKKREYLSRFSSNVALTYRKEATTKEEKPPVPEAAPGMDFSQLLSGLSQQAPSAPVPERERGKQRPVDEPTEKLPERAKVAREGDLREASKDSRIVAPSEKTYVVWEGTIIETVLLNRLDGEFVGPVECLVSANVYSPDRQHLLIPDGTKALGEARHVDHAGQTRLAIVFHRLLMPDGFSVGLDKFAGLDMAGDTGLRDRVNNHYLRLFGTSLALGALGAVSEAGSGNSFSTSNGELFRQGFGTSLAQSSTQILDKFLNVLPSVSIREGHRVKIYISGDLALPEYGSHRPNQ